MQEKILFKNKVGSFVTNLQLKEKLEELNAHKCDILYVHTALSFGVPQVKRVELLDELFAVFALLRIPTLIFPTFTFSFPNGEDYDVQDSKTSMGIFNEYFRKQNGVIRSVDPLMSNALLGKHVEFVSKIGKNSCGKDSTFDMLHKSELNVKFLFFGTRIGDCFTFMHYIEDELHVSYRYSCPFTGKITNQNKSYIDTYYLPVRYGNVTPGTGSYIYENILIERGIAKQVHLGDSRITIVPEQTAFAIYQDIIQSYPCFFISAPFNKNEKTAMINTTKMVAL